MINYRKHIDDFFREKLGNYREAPPPEAWGELEQRLDGLTPALPSQYYRFIPHIAIISLLVVMGISAGKKLAGNTGNTVPLISSTTGQPVALQTNPSQNSPTANEETVTPAGSSDQGSATQQNTASKEEAGGKPTNNNSIQVIPVSASSIGNNTGRRKHNKHYLASRMMGRTSPFRQEERSNWTGTKPKEETVYNAPVNNEQPIEATNNNSAASPGLTLSGKPRQEEILPGTFKKEESKKVNNQNGEEPTARTKRLNIGFIRFEAGVKGGYEQGFTDGSAKKYVVSPYLQYNISSKVAIMTQPAVKYANVDTRNLGSKSYYNVNNRITSNDSSYPIYDTRGTSIDTFTVHKFTTTQSHDSIVKSYKNGGSYMEYELPVLVKIKLSNKVSVYGGLNMIYNKPSGVTETTTGAKGLTRKSVSQPDTVLLGTPVSSPDVNFVYNGAPIQDYKNPYPAQPTSQLSVGYMLGLSYSLNKRWLTDALIQQTPINTKSSNVLNSTTTYFRISIGYKLTK
jgi:hypothetical protein